MKNKIIASVLAVAFAFSMVGSAEAATIEELQAQITQLLQMIIQLQAQLAIQTNITNQQPITTTTITHISSCGQEGEKLNRNPFFGATNKVCCSGLTDIRESKSYSVCVNCGDGVCKYPENQNNCPKDCHISVLPECQWCGKACMRVYPWMACPNIVPPQGYRCAEINGQCRSTFTPSPTIPPTTTTTPTTTYLPDLTISSIRADKTTLNIGETTKISALEKNIGNISAGHHYTGIFEDKIETPIGSSETNILASGYGLIIEADYTCLKAGSHTVTALADFIHRVPTGEVVESNENNNSKTITINCVALPISTTTTIPTIKYTCNPSTWKCVATYGGGQYDSLSTCQARCQTPTTTIPSTYPCSWCGSACTRVAPGTMCPTSPPPPGYTCVEINGQCRSTFTPSPTIPPTTTTKPPTVSKCTELQTVLTNSYGSECGSIKYNHIADLGGYLGDPLKDGKINFEDLMIFSTNAQNETWCAEQLQSTINPCAINLESTSAINDILNKLKASLISILELLK